MPSASIIPNSFWFIIGFLSLCRLTEVQTTISLFRNFYTFKLHSFTKDCWYFSLKVGKKGLLKGAPSSIHNWKKKFFFVHCLTLPLGLPSWGYIRESICRAPSLDGADLDSSNKLKVYQASLLSNLLKEQTLFNLGLSPHDLTGTSFDFQIHMISCTCIATDRSSFPATEMDTQAAKMLTKGLFTRKRKEKMQDDGSKRVKVSISSSGDPTSTIATFEVIVDA
ncbi:hypothetical protein COCNU_scaffold002235G000030 [Cocos nucifera]|nr:hypothetical protein [Cocos nucifera]